MNRTRNLIRTGFVPLDKILGGGLCKGELTVLCSRFTPAMTALSLGISSHAALKARQPVVLFSSKLSRHAVMERLIAHQVQLNPADLHSGYFNPTKWPALKRASARFSDAPLYIAYSPNQAVSDVLGISAHLSQAIRPPKQPLCLLIIDHLQTLRGPSNVRVPDRRNEVALILKDLKWLATQFKVAVLLLSRLAGRPRSHAWSFSQTAVDLEESGITDHFDNAILLHRDHAGRSRTRARLFVSRRPLQTFRHCDIRFESINHASTAGVKEC